MGSFDLTLQVNMGYNAGMFESIVSFFLRIWLILVLWAFVWRVFKPKNQVMRILRAAVLVLCLFGILVILRTTG